LFGQFLLFYIYLNFTVSNFKIHTVVSRDEFTILYMCIASRDCTVYLYANRRVASTRDYRISITAEPMKFWIGAIDSLGSNYIIKLFSFFLYVPYERRYCDAKFESGNFLLRNVIVMIGVDRSWAVFENFTRVR